jgi:hypothetical protein
MLLQALKPWWNPDYEGHVSPGQLFEAGELRAQELVRSGLAMPATLPETTKIRVVADAPKPRRRG